MQNTVMPAAFDRTWCSSRNIVHSFVPSLAKAKLLGGLRKKTYMRHVVDVLDFGKSINDFYLL